MFDVSTRKRPASDFETKLEQEQWPFLSMKELNKL